MTTQTSSAKAYNLKITPKGAVEDATTASGTRKIKFRGTYVVQGKERERTVIAQGKAAELIAGMVTTGEEIGLRCIFETAPALEEGKKGGEFVTVVALPRAKAA